MQQFQCESNLSFIFFYNRGFQLFFLFHSDFIFVCFCFSQIPLGHRREAQHNTTDRLCGSKILHILVKEEKFGESAAVTKKNSSLRT